MSSQSVLLQLVESLYNTLVESQGWQQFVSMLSRSIGSASIAVHLDDCEARWRDLVPDPTLDPGYERLYEETYVALNLLCASVTHTHSPDFVRSLRSGCLSESLIGVDYARERGLSEQVFYGTGAAISGDCLSTSHVFAFRLKSAGAFTTGELGLLNDLMPYLGRVLQLHRRIARSEWERKACGQILDKLPVGIILLDENAHVMKVNLSAQAISDQRDGLTISPIGLEAALSRESRALQNLIRTAVQARQGSECDSAEGIRVTRPSMKRPLFVLVVRLHPTPSLLGNEGPAAAVLISDPEAQAVNADSVLRRVYGLTHSEARLAHLLLQGKSLEDVALELHITGQTARTHLKRLFSKTDTHRQSELVRLLLISPAILRSV